MKLFKTIRTHWKKSVLLTLLSAGGARYGFNRYQENLLLHQYGHKLRPHGDVRIGAEERPRQIIVFLNGSAANGKAGKTFKKFAVPMMSVSGVNFVVVPTSYEGHVGSLLKYLPEGTEAVVVAGGDGMLQETLTSLRRAGSSLPLGFIPLGERSTFCERLLHSEDRLTRVDKICQSVAAIVEGRVERVPVMEITPETGKTLYAVSYLTCGHAKRFIDLRSKMPENWVLGSMALLYGMLRYADRWAETFSARVNGDSEYSFGSISLLLSDRSGPLTLVEQNPVSSVTEYLERLVEPIEAHHSDGLVAQLQALGKRTPALTEASIVPSEGEKGKFCIDGEEAGCRPVRVACSEVDMFAPEEGSCRAGVVEVVPALPDRVKQLLEMVKERVRESVS